MDNLDIISERLVKISEAIMLAKSPEMKTVKRLRDCDSKMISEYPYLLTTQEGFEQTLSSRFALSILEFVDIDANSKEERNKALKHFMENDGRELIAIVTNKENVRCKHKYGCHIIYKAEGDTRSRIFRKRSSPFKCVDGTVHANCTKNPFCKRYESYSDFNQIPSLNNDGWG